MDAANGLYLLSENSDHLFFIYDCGNATFAYLNPAFKAFFEIRGSDPLPEELLLMVHPEDRSYLLKKLAHLQTEISGKESIECRIINGDHERSLLVNAHLERGSGNETIVGLAEDITLFKENAEVLLRHGNKKNSILNILTHDLAGPIGAIGNFCDLINRTYQGPQYASLQSHLNRINMISMSCIKLIRDFLDQEFLESAGVRLIKRRVNISEKIAETIVHYQSMDLGVTIISNCGEKQVFIEIDQDKFLQVIHNLISNSLKFTPEGGTITINLQVHEHKLVISVADTGIGIPEKYHHTLFDKFTEARRNGLNGEYSTGLGMSIIKTIVEWHGGTIWFESEENKGTVFYVELPNDKL